MAVDDVVPHVGIKIDDSRMLRLGMSREEAESLLGSRPHLQVDYRGDPPVVAFIQSPKHWGTYDGIELFETAADEVIAEIVRRRDLDPSIYRPGEGSYLFPDLGMILWRSCASSVEGDQGYVFDCVSLHAPGYYSPELMAYLRRQNRLSVEPANPNER
jgi:hypothetical protein